MRDLKGELKRLKNLKKMYIIDNRLDKVKGVKKKEAGAPS